MARPPLSRRLRARISLWATLALAAIPANAQAGSLAEPIDPFQQTAFAFPERSHWLQPWRGYLETVPASRLRGAIGINYDPGPGQAPATARLLSASGFSRARIEEAWGSVSYADRSQLENLEEFRSWLVALRDHGIRPLILLNVNHGAPGPTRRFQARLVASAAQGAREVRVDAATANAIVPGRTGLDALNVYKAAEILFTHVAADGTATLSKPLPQPRPAGTYPATTLAYAPFQRPLRSDGSPNPAFEETMAGWLSYVDLVLSEARNTLGSSNFDVEVWNELSFGSDFLDARNYYDPAPDTGVGDTKREILERTIAKVRDPAEGFSGVRIGNGFANQTPFEAGSTSPPGLDAIDKHPYQGLMRFPGSQPISNQPPLDAQGRLDGYLVGEDTWADSYTPSYVAFFPEYYLSAIQAETLVRDISPISTRIGSVWHGRHTHPAGGPAPQVWITETGMNVYAPDAADPSPPAPPSTYMSESDIEHLRAKATLRAAVAFVNKGVSAIDFYAAKDPKWALVPDSFFDQVDAAGGSYPGDDAGGETMTAMRRLLARFQGPDQVSGRQLSLRTVSDQHDQLQFTGDGTDAHPPLYNRDVVAFLPFQASADRFVIPAYVMTRNIAELQRPGAPASDPTRYDLPPATYRLAIGGIDGGAASVEAYDPLSGTSTSAHVVSRSGDGLVVEMELTDSPRLLELRAQPPDISASGSPASGDDAVTEAPRIHLSEARVAGRRITLQALVSEPLRGRAAVKFRYRACGLTRTVSRRVEFNGGEIALSIQLPRSLRGAKSIRGRFIARVLGTSGRQAYRTDVLASREDRNPRGC